MASTHARFGIGELIHHKLFNYRGVVVDVDPEFMGTDEWYEQATRTQPPKDQPWYHVLVHDSDGQTYVAERNLEADTTGAPINHPFIDSVFTEFRGGVYSNPRSSN
jgi:heat shock protein HspQ